jgi:hypothetical protein
MPVIARFNASSRTHQTGLLPFDHEAEHRLAATMTRSYQD